MRCTLHRILVARLTSSQVWIDSGVKYSVEVFMLGYKHSDITMEERILKVAGLGAFLSTALAAVSVALGEWSGFFNSPHPLGAIAAIASALVAMALLFVLYFDKHLIRNTILFASGLLALFITYQAGVYGLILMTGAVVLAIAAVPNRYRLLAGYSIAALMSVSLLLSEAFSPSAESLQMLTTLAVIPYPLALLFNTSVPADSARLKAFQALMLLGLSGRLWLFNEGLEVNNYGLGALGAAAVFAITWKLRRIPLPLGIGFLILASLFALSNGFSQGSSY